jgi:hypothetical protein
MKTCVHLYLSQLPLELEIFQTNVEKIKTHMLLNNFFPKVVWKNMVEADRPQMTIWRMRFACWVTKATDTRSEYAILIAFPRQQWLRERASMLRLYVHCLSCLDLT